MSETVIRVEGLSKRYRLGEGGAGKYSYRSFREEITNFLSSPFRRRAAGDDFIWALRDASFEVKQGEAVGIIGRNGAGKTTLLKILSRITEPSEGRVDLYGRVRSLLEVGTGFHPELTGRENIYLNGAIMGMKKAEIRSKFDEIVAFAEIEKFLDTPVKRYSSGMYVRLAFSVAAHLEPEILLVDEVLAVGDAAFQKKCMGKMGDVARGGRTVLFVSHNMGAINRLCVKGILLNEGRVQKLGNTEDVVAAYLSTGTGNEAGGECRWDERQRVPGDEHIRLRAVRILNSSGEAGNRLDIRLPFQVEIEYEVLRVLPTVRIGFRIVTTDGTVVFTTSDNNDSAWEGKPRHPGIYVSRCEIPGNLLNEGQYSLLNVWADIPFVKVMFLEENLLSFHLEQTGGVGGRLPEKWSGVICPALKWKISVSKGDGGA